jgi:PhnB protein
MPAAIVVPCRIDPVAGKVCGIARTRGPDNKRLHGRTLSPPPRRITRSLRPKPLTSEDATMTKPQPIPEGYGTVTPWVVTRDTRRLLEFIKEAFDAEELARVEVEGGAIGHAEARIGDSIIMMFDSPFPVATPGLLRLYVEDGDAAFRRAVAAGATPVTQLTELAWGDRVGRVRDPLGNIWWIQERTEEPSPDEVARRFQDPKFTEGMQYVQSSLAPGLDAS